MERLDHFMARANAAYYATHDPYRDFTTSPEISQVFGEILGLWATIVWEQLGHPDPVLLVEAGPGRGTLMADAWRAIGSVAPTFRAALRLHLIETSPRLRALQAERLPGATWHDGLETLPDLPLLLLANEFLDALPIRQFVRRGGQWFERYVEDGRFLECGPPPPNPLPQGEGEYFGQNTPPPLAGGGWGEGAQGIVVFELSESALAIGQSLGNRLSTRAGAALFLDYGPEHSARGDSLQALSNGRPADPLTSPGTADLTAHVDFAAFADAACAAGAATFGPVPQGLFLTRLGLFQRTDRLARTRPPAQAAAMIEAARRLAEPDRMGRLFKALAVCSPGCPTPPGFET
ncbi:MAG TPA: SAM-dependent methyltransferase [Acetobacteraceae bacterium]|nr:SAM-dependent methyltransferase [Acetobacteraceae bacterium]